MLSVADVALIRLYRSLLLSARNVQEGRDPVGVGADVTRIAGANGRLDKGEDWRSLVPTHRRAAATARLKTA
jgi:hypothetical protein